jgi:hypothetical protein
VARAATWILFAAVATVAAAAALDAFDRDEEAVAQRAAGGRTGGELRHVRAPAGAAAAMHAAGASGTLVFEDRSCRLWAVALPELAVSSVRTMPMCGFPLEAARAPAGCRVALADALALTLGGQLSALASSCAPWLYDALRAELGDRCVRAEVREVAWRTPARVAAIAYCRRRDGASRDYLALFTNRRLAAPLSGPHRRLRDLRTSPHGRYVSVLVGPSRPLVLERGRRVALPGGFRGTRAVAWSPDERWIAVGTKRGVYMFPRERPRLHFLPVQAFDLAWRKRR